uniref:SRR1-like domain-containing protein n=1 Tax=Chromera velia CCMP2878 TaxID=1169474 RepID=A0A0G4HTW4_9ALVE|eukprot:Cvel_8537.t1-p1 / transcript=Cvel_8537.t1 / gene=Cvel_8537 / organism=Chromera_velia_CCMP2878 / gene_product=hypothetical protein / transcript_product=hypothetical protein / location=Cvel_scaffold473:36197-40853(+) / protein_length=482 / sequence_SO=supercontig / SO=protein_coding / is_pseudo=false
MTDWNTVGKSSKRRAKWTKGGGGNAGRSLQHDSSPLDFLDEPATRQNVIKRATQVLDCKKKVEASLFWKELEEALLSACTTVVGRFPSLRKSRARADWRVVCLGIGSLERFEVSRHQLGLVLSILDLLQIPAAKVWVSDPVMTQVDRALVEHLGMNLHPSAPLSSSRPGTAPGDVALDEETEDEEGDEEEDGDPRTKGGGGGGSSRMISRRQTIEGASSSSSSSPSPPSVPPVVSPHRHGHGRDGQVVRSTQTRPSREEQPESGPFPPAVGGRGEQKDEENRPSHDDNLEVIFREALRREQDEEKDIQELLQKIPFLTSNGQGQPEGGGGGEGAKETERVRKDEEKGKETGEEEAEVEDDPCLFCFMPHCDKDLFGRAILQWVLRGFADRTVLLGNLLSKYEMHPLLHSSSSSCSKESLYRQVVEETIPFASEICVEAPFLDALSAFNDIGATTFDSRLASGLQVLSRMSSEGQQIEAGVRL